MKRWTGGVARSHEELDDADAAFWEEAGPTARFIASIAVALALQAKAPR